MLVSPELVIAAIATARVSPSPPPSSRRFDSASHRRRPLAGCVAVPSLPYLQARRYTGAVRLHFQTNHSPARSTDQTADVLVATHRPVHDQSRRCRASEAARVASSRCRQAVQVQAGVGELIPRFVGYGVGRTHGTSTLEWNCNISSIRYAVFHLLLVCFVARFSFYGHGAAGCGDGNANGNTKRPRR
jgi:hypothetical protein